jgi:hypothetical protein
LGIRVQLIKGKRQGRIEELNYLKFESSISLQLNESTHAKLQSKKNNLSMVGAFSAMEGK